MNNDFILQLYSKPETVFTVSEIAQQFPEIPYESLRDRLYYFSKAGKLSHLHQGLYAKKTYNPFELVNKLYTPSYISLETVLVKAGIVFQYYETVFAVTYLTRSIAIDTVSVQYRKIKSDVLTNTQGLEQRTGYFMASPERAFLDAVYIYKNYHFDNLGPIDWQKVDSLKNIYASKAFEKRLAGYYKLYKKDYAKH